MTFFDFLDFLGTAAFAISGALVAMRKKFDLFGVFIIGFVTAVGGGTVRDILIGRQPVTWMDNTDYIFVCIVATIFAILVRNKIKYVSKSLSLFDTIGLGIFTIIGTNIGVNADFNPVVSVALGTITATFGGVLRDILCNRVPIIFKKEIYATACILGGSVFIILQKLEVGINFLYTITALTVIAIRFIAIKFHLSLPLIYKK